MAGKSYRKPRSTTFVSGSAGRDRGRHAAAGGGRRILETRANPSGTVAEVVAGIAAGYDEEIAALQGEYSRAIGGIGGGGSGVSEALAMLRDVQGNRAAIKGIYDDVRGFLDPITAEAVSTAEGLVAAATPEFEGIASEAKAGIEGSYDLTEQEIADAAALINAGEGAAASVAADAVSGQDLALAAEFAEAAGATELLGLRGEAHTAQAIAQRDLGNEAFNRRTALLDTEFAGMEDAARARVAAARRAAAAAAARRRAMASERDLAIADLQKEKALAMRLNPHEAGEATALTYLRKRGSNLDYNRQQLVLSTLSNALSQQVPSRSVNRWAQEQGLTGTAGGLTKPELDLVRGGLQSYTLGMRYQQGIDRNRGYTAPTYLPER